MRPLWGLRLIQGAIALEILLTAGYFAMVMRWGHTWPGLDFNSLRSLPSLLQAAHLAAISLLCVVLMLDRRHLSRRLSLGTLGAIALLCFYGTLDKLTKLHLQFHQVNWQAVYLGVLMVIPLMGWRDLRWIWQCHRAIVGWMTTGLGLFLLGGFGAEWVKGSLAHGLLPHASSQMLFFTEHLRIAIEESAELMGETLVLYGFVQLFWHIKRPQKAASSAPQLPP